MSVPERSPERAEVRVGDAERQAVVDQLRLHLGAGRLTVLEFEERAEQALAARVVGDLVPLTADLPAVSTRPSGPPVRPQPVKVRSKDPWDVVFRVHVGVWIVLSVFFVFIAAATSSGSWPIYPILSIGLSVGIHGAVKQAVRG